MNLLDMKKGDLRAKCKELGISGYGNMTVDAMRSAIEAKLAEQNKPEPQLELEEVQETAEERRLRIQAAVEAAKATTAEKTVVIDGRRARKLEKVETNKGRSGYRIEKNRPVQNGVKMPSVGTICHKLWSTYSEMKSPTIKQVKEMADEYGYDRTTATIQFYAWRKFNGITGRSE